MNTQAAGSIVSTLAATTFTYREMRALRTLRRHYQQDRDLFDERERAYLRFVRWLYQSDALKP